MKKIVTKLYNYIKYFFTDKELEYDLSEYRTHESISSDDRLLEIVLPVVPNNNKINLIIMDDNESAGEITKKEIMKLHEISQSINDTGLEKLNRFNSAFIQKLTNMQLIKLTKFDINNYNIIMCTGKMAAFQVIGLIEKDVKIDKAFLDILIGGYNVYKGRCTILDGIDVAKDILESNPDSKILFYSGCSLDEDSVECRKSDELLHKDIRKIVLGKDNDTYGKKVKLIEFMVD